MNRFEIAVNNNDQQQNNDKHDADDADVDFDILKIVEARQRLTNGAATTDLEPVFRSETKTASTKVHGGEEQQATGEYRKPAAKRGRQPRTSRAANKGRQDQEEAEETETDDIDLMKVVRARAHAIHEQEEREAAAAAVATTPIKGLPPTDLLVGNNGNTHDHVRRPGAYAGAPGVDLQRAETLRFSLVGRTQEDDKYDEEAQLENRSSLKDIHERGGGDSSNSNDEEERRRAAFCNHFTISNDSNAQDLAVANLVSSTLELPDSMPLAEELDGSRQRTHITIEEWEERDKIHRKRAVVLLALVILVVVGVVVALVLLIDTNTGGTTNTDRNTTPSISMTVSPDEYLQSLLPDYTVKELDNQVSAQFKAFRWSASDPFFANHSDWQLVQRFALAVVYFATDGTHWFDNTNWLSWNHPVCQWYSNSSNNCPQNNRSSFQLLGNDPRVESIDLETNGLKGELPEQFYLLTDLQSIYLTGNQLKGTLSSRIGQLPELLALSLASNDLTGSIPSEIGLARSLSDLFLLSNNLVGAIPTGTPGFGQRFSM